MYVHIELISFPCIPGCEIVQKGELFCSGDGSFSQFSHDILQTYPSWNHSEHDLYNNNSCLVSRLLTLAYIVEYCIYSSAILSKLDMNVLRP